MSCKHCDFETGICAYHDDGIERFGCDEDGICICEDDENPEDSCEDYEEC